MSFALSVEELANYERVATEYHLVLRWLKLQLLAGACVSGVVWAVDNLLPQTCREAPLAVPLVLAIILLPTISLSDHTRRLASHLGCRLPSVWAAFMLYPLANLLALPVLRLTVLSWCQQRGLTMRVWGLSRQELEDLRYAIALGQDALPVAK